MKQFCANHRRALLTLSLVSGLFAVCMCMTACNVPAWLTDAESLIPIIAASVTSILSFVAGITGDPKLSALLNVIVGIITDVGNGLADLEKLISDYKASPSDPLLVQIEAVAADIKANLAQVLSNTGLPPALAATINSWAQLALSQLEAWLAVLPSLKAAVMAQNVHTLSKPADDRIMSAAALKDSFNAILDKKTGDPKVDKALAKAIRIK
jgi:hypothetical protein